MHTCKNTLAHAYLHTCTLAHMHTCTHAHLHMRMHTSGRLLRHLGITLSLTTMPMVCALGILMVGARPCMSSVALAEVLRKVIGYSMVKPAREVSRRLGVLA